MALWDLGGRNVGVAALDVVLVDRGRSVVVCAAATDAGVSERDTLNRGGCELHVLCRRACRAIYVVSLHRRRAGIPKQGYRMGCGRPAARQSDRRR